jgi:hypothetical protein
METASKLSHPTAAQGDHDVAGRNGSKARGDPSYARDLRVVGQMLESHDIVTVDLIFVADTYIIQARVRATPKRGLSISFLRDWVKGVKSGFTANSKNREMSAEAVTLRCRREEVLELDLDARRRRATDNGMPDPYALSQKLRSAGAYLDTRKRSSLIGILLREREMTIRFESGEGRLEETRRDVDYFYDYWVKMYLRRNERIQPDSFHSMLPHSLRDEIQRG